MKKRNKLFDLKKCRYILKYVSESEYTFLKVKRTQHSNKALSCLNINIRTRYM